MDEGKKTTTVNLARLLTDLGLIKTLGDSRRILAQNGVKINGEVQDFLARETVVREGDIIEVGKHKKIELKLGGFTPRKGPSTIEPAYFES